MADISDIIDYYVNLLIIQYNGQPKAAAQIGLIAKEMLANGILLDIQNAYDVDTAVGVQLDVIGKYVGVDRYYSKLDLENFFSLETYDEPPPASPPRWGFTDYAHYGDYQYRGTLTYSQVIAQNNALNDDDFRVIIKFKILINNSNFSNADIDNETFKIFNTTIRPEPNGLMKMAYFITANLTEVIFALLFKSLLPRPMGVGVIAVSGVTGNMFALTDYSGYETPFGYGFSDYSDYDTLAGQVLTYNQMSGD